jgi:DNA adenine methylase
MRYFGGKSVYGKKIAHFILNYLIERGIDLNTTVYIEPFCGALGVFKYIVPYVKKSYANDISKDLILLWKQVQKEMFKNPHINQTTWSKLKYETKPSAERAFAGFGCSFGGVWFNGYICDNGNNDMTYNTLVKIAPLIKNTIFTNFDYEKILNKVLHDSKKTYVIYMDPPYRGTCNLPWGEFDSTQFWNIVRKLSKIKNVIVIVSEVSAPSDFKCIYRFKRRNGMHNTTDKTEIEEKLYVLRV